MRPTYDVTKSAKWNRENGPLIEGDVLERSAFRQPTKVWDFELNSPLGIAEGPLFDSKFVDLYARLGFDFLVYKTVRSVEREAHQNPNIVFVDAGKTLNEEQIGGTLTTREEPQDLNELTITNSFGVNSVAPQAWQVDFAKAQASLAPGQLLALSVMGTAGLERELDDDYAYAAAMAKDAGAKVIFLNFSCPNLKGGSEGEIFTDPASSSRIAEKVKKAIGNIPLVIKIGHYKDEAVLAAVLKANAPFVDGISAINTIRMNVRKADGEQALPGEGRLASGLCGAAIHQLAVKTVTAIAAEKQKNNYDFELIGVGGVTEAARFDNFLNAGAKIAMSAAGAMWNPLLAQEWGNAHAGGVS